MNHLLGFAGLWNFDYLIKARIAQMADYRTLLGDILLTLPGAQESRSYIVMEEVKEGFALPLEKSQE